MTGRLWKFVGGYVRIRLTGLSLNRLVNSALAQGVTLRQLNRRSYTCLEGDIALGDRRRLAEMAGQAGVEFTELSRRGLPVLGARAAGRPGLLTGLAAMALVLALLSRVILVVDITGVEDGPTVLAVRRVVGEMGIYPGAVMPRQSVSDMENAAMLALPELSFIGIGKRGMRVTVEVVPKILPQGMVDRDTPCHLVADRDGIVESIVVQEGVAVVTPGTLVRAGQLLVSGRVALSDGRVLLKHAMATVTATRWYRGERSQDTIRRIYRHTGRSAAWVDLCVGSWSFRLYCQGEIDTLGLCETRRRDVLLLGEGFLIPIVLRTTRALEAVPEDQVLDRAAILTELTRQARLDALAQVPAGAEVVDETVRQSMDGSGRLTVTVTVQTKERIGTEVPLAD